MIEYLPTIIYLLYLPTTRFVKVRVSAKRSNEICLILHIIILYYITTYITMTRGKRQGNDGQYTFIYEIDT